MEQSHFQIFQKMKNGAFDEQTRQMGQPQPDKQFLCECHKIHLLNFEAGSVLDDGCYILILE